MKKAAAFIGKQLHLSSPSQIVDYEFDWTIENFKFHLEKNGGYIESPLAQTVDKKYSWKLRLYFNGESYDSNGYISIYLYNESSNRNFISKAEISFLNCPSIPKYTKLVIRPEVYNMGYPKFISKVALAKDPGFCSNDYLTVLCKIQILEDLRQQSCEGLIISQRNSLYEDFYCLFKNKSFCDATLLVDKSEFKVHKLILSARSSVFAAMFSHNFEETQTNIIKVLDASPGIMEEVIEYMYTDKFPRLTEHVEDVLPIAEKYALLGLKDMCVKTLYSQLTISTAAHILLLADLYNITDLKENIIKFIVMNFKTVSVTPSWIEMTANNHTLVAEVTLEFFSKLHISNNSAT